MATLTSIFNSAKNAAKSFLFGDKNPEDASVVKVAKETLIGQEQKSGNMATALASVVAKSSLGKAATLPHTQEALRAEIADLKKNENLVNAAIRDIRSGKPVTPEQKAAIDKLQYRIDTYIGNGVPPLPKDQQAYLDLCEAQRFNAYQNIKERAKDPNAPAIVKSIASRPYQRDMSNPWKDFKGYNTDTILKIYYGSAPVEKLNEKQKTQYLERIMREHEPIRRAFERVTGNTVTPYKAPTQETPIEKQAKDAVKNISNLKDWGSKDTQTQNLQVSVQSRFDTLLDESRNQDQGQSQGFGR